jgi:hypothetical protein
MNGSVGALAVLADGQLVAGGDFTTAGGSAANRVARWSGTSWSALGSGVNQSVRALEALPNGDLIAGGAFTTAGGIPANRVARWDGIAWSGLGAGIAPGSSFGSVASLERLPSGAIAVGGTFSTAGAIAAQNVAIWNGASWSTLGLGFFGSVNSLKVLPNGDLLAGGQFDLADGKLAFSVARWDGGTWSGYGGGIKLGSTSNAGAVRTLTLLPTGDVVAAGSFDIAGKLTAFDIARWTGANWTTIGGGFSQEVLALATATNGDLIAGGRFKSSGTQALNYIARFDGNAWFPLGSGVNGEVYALHIRPNGDVLAGGIFSEAGGAPASKIARWDGNSWSALGSGFTIGSAPTFPFPFALVYTITGLPNGDIVAGGQFNLAGATPVDSVARWDGTTWSALPPIPNGKPWSGVGLVTLRPNGSLLVSGNWFESPASPPFPAVYVSRLAELTGSNWTILAQGSSVSGVTHLPNGDMVVGGTFGAIGSVLASNVARWNGSAWSPLGSGVNGGVSSLATLPNGDLVVAGSFTSAGGAPAARIARWNGATWSALGAGLTGQAAIGGGAQALALRPSGELCVGGSFANAGGLTSPFFARYATPCPATVVDSNPGCASSGGNNQFSALTLPWLGSKFRTRGTGLPNSAVVGALTGYSTTAIPLAALLPPAGVGCTLWTLPDLIDVKFVTNGTLDHELQLKSNPAAIGLNFYQQLIVLELDQNLNVVETTSTNALTATVGFL